MAATLVKLDPPKKNHRAYVETILVTPDDVMAWENPPFQRPKKINDKMREIAEIIKDDRGIIPGVISLGQLADTHENRQHKGKTFLIDGQHRREAFLLSGCTEGLCDAKIMTFDSMADMGEEFVNINSSIVRLKADDVLRGLEGSSDAISYIRKRCPYVGYDNLRRGPSSPILSMSTMLRCWLSSGTDVPGGASFSVTHRVKDMTVEEALQTADFLDIAIVAWGRDPEYSRLWGSLNLVLCMWWYRKVVLQAYSQKVPRMDKDLFRKCLTGLSASASYSEWLMNRRICDRERSPAFHRIKTIFGKVIEDTTGKRKLLPAPDWASK